MTSGAGRSRQESAVAARRTPEALKALLRDYYATHGAIPSIAMLASLWGFASKSSASRIVASMIEQGFLAEAPGRRLRPGPAFAGEAGSDAADEVDRAVDRWEQGYADSPSRAYDLTVRILRLARSIDAGIGRSAARWGLTIGELLVLDTLYRLGPPHRIAPTALKRHFLISLAGIGKRVDQLQELGLVDRVPDEKDGRSMLVQLNAKGRNLLERAVEADRTEPHITWAIELSDEERATLTAILRRAQRKVDAATTPAGGESI